MRTRFLVVVATLLLALAAWPATAQYEPTLPPGIVSIEVDGQTINSLAVPQTDSSTPEISGRVDDSVPSLGLAVSNGDIVRFPATIGGSGRFRAVPPQPLADGFYALYANDLLVGSFSIAGGTPGPRVPGALLDIARVTPYPADAAQSLPALSFLDGRFISLREEAVRTAAGNPDGPDAGEIERQLAQAGWLQRYENRLAVPNGDDPRRFDIQISSFVVEYASGADARTAFDSLSSGDAVEFASVGDESRLVLLSGATPDTGADYQAARLVLRVGPLLSVIVYADLRNEPPDLDLLQTIGATVAARGGLVADRQVIPLGSMTLRPDLSGAQTGTVVSALYENRGGAMTAMFGEDEATRTERADVLAGTTDAFTSSTSGDFLRSGNARNNRRSGNSSVAATPGAGDAVASPGPNPAPARVSFRTALYAFPSESEADIWTATQENALDAGESEETVYQRLSEAPALADAAAVYTMVTRQEDGTELHGYRIYARSGLIVAVLDVQSSPAVSLRGAVGLMEEQLACIAAGGCAGSASLPGSMFGARDRPAG